MKRNYLKFLLLSFAACSLIVMGTLCGCRAHQCRVPGKSWTPLYQNSADTANWMSARGESFPSRGWQADDGELILLADGKGGDIITREEYSDFELKLEFNFAPFANSGVKYFVNKMTHKETGAEEWIGFECQIIDDFNPEKSGCTSEKISTASLYLLYAPDKKKELHPSGEWNSLRIRVKGAKVEHWLNGKKVMEADTGSREFFERVEETKFKNYDGFGKIKKGRILLQDHGDGMHFRNIFIREL